jgi:hypothetical protein
MNIFTTDHPLVSEPMEYPVLQRIFTRKTLIPALIVSVFAEALCAAGLYFLTDTSFFSFVCGYFHFPGCIVGWIFVPDVIDDYATKDQEFIWYCIVVAIGWLQWFVIFIACRFFAGPRIISPPNKSPEPTAVGPFSSAFAVHVASRRWLSFLR